VYIIFFNICENFAKKNLGPTRVADIAYQQKSQVFTFLLDYSVGSFVVVHSGRRRRKRSLPGATEQFDLSKEQWIDRAPTHRESRRRGGGGRGERVSPSLLRQGAMTPPQKILNFFHLKILHSDAFSYTNSKGLFAIKCREKYVITVFLAVNTDMRTSNFHQSRKVIPIQSASTNLRRFHSYSRHVL